MAAPLPTKKSTVDLAAPAVRVSRIRRDPPPVAKVDPIDQREIDRRNTVVGVIVFALAIAVAILGIGSMSGWSMSNHRVVLSVDE